MFETEELPRLVPPPAGRYDLPIYATAKVHRDHHVEVAKALYSVPGNLIGTRVEVRADRALVRIFQRGQLVKVHPRQPPGRRSTDPADLPADKTVYAMRDLDRLRRMAAGHGDAIGVYAAALLDIPLPWTKMRQVYALLGLVKKWGAERVNTACASALDHEVINVGLIGRMLERGTEATTIQPALPGTVVIAGRFARDPDHFAVTRSGTMTRHHHHGQPGAAGVAAPGQARPLLGHPPRTARSGPHRPDGTRRVPRARLGRRGHPPRDHLRRPARPTAAGLDPEMTLDRWDDTAKITYDHTVWNELCSLRFVESGHNAVIMGPVGVGKTFLATALGHAAVRRRFTVHFERCDRLLKRLRASRLDNSHDVEMRRLLRVDLLIVDDFALQPLDALDTADIYELIVERHRAAATVATSNREPIEWLGLMADPLLAQSAIDRLQSAAHELVLDGESYRKRQKPNVTNPTDDLDRTRQLGDHRDADADTREPVPSHWRTVVPSSWRTTGDTRMLGSLCGGLSDPWCGQRLRRRRGERQAGSGVGAAPHVVGGGGVDLAER